MLEVHLMSQQKEGVQQSYLLSLISVVVLMISVSLVITHIFHSSIRSDTRNTFIIDKPITNINNLNHGE